MNRCVYCGHAISRGARTCQYHAHLVRVETAMRAEHPAKTRFRATCPKCGEIAKPGRRICAFCRTYLYPTDAMLAALTREDAQATKGTAS